MMIEAHIHQHLRQHSSIKKLIKNRIYPLIKPQSAPLPAITYQRISSIRRINYLGPEKLLETRIQLSAWAESYKMSKQLATALRKALHGYSGKMGKLKVPLIRLESDRDSYEPDTQTYCIHQDYLIHFEESL